MSDERQPPETGGNELDEELPLGDTGEAPPEDPGSDANPQELPEPSAAPRRDQNQRLREQREKLIRENAEQAAELRLLRQAQQVPRQAPDPNAVQAAEAQRWQAYREAVDQGRMTPVDVVREIWQHGQQTVQQQLMAQQAALSDRIDKQAYESAAGGSKVHRDYAARVEQMLGSERASGNYGATRAAILAYLVGQDAIARSQAAAPAQRRQAAQRVAGQQARPTAAAGDGARPASRQQSNADEELLRSITINDI